MQCMFFLKLTLLLMIHSANDVLVDLPVQCVIDSSKKIEDKPTQQTAARHQDCAAIFLIHLVPM